MAAGLSFIKQTVNNLLTAGKLPLRKIVFIVRDKRPEAGKNSVFSAPGEILRAVDYLRENGKYALPLINKEYIDEYGLINSKGAVPPGEHLDDYYKYTEAFGGIFDPQPMGQYLGGTDRKPKGVANNAGFKNEYSYVDISKLDIIWKKKGEGYVPVLKWKDKEYRIYDLHVHCKELNRFRSDIAREG